MKKNAFLKRFLRTVIMIFVDSVMGVSAFLLSSIFRSNGSLLLTVTSTFKYVNFLSFACAVVPSIVLIAFAQGYSTSWRYATFKSYARLGFASVLGSFISMLLILISNVKISKTYTILMAIIMALLVCYWRMLIGYIRRNFGNIMAYGPGTKRILIVGGGDTGSALINSMKKKTGLVPVAVIDDTPTKWGLRINGVPIIGGRDKISFAAEKYKADEIIIAIPSADNTSMLAIVDECSKTMLKVRTVPSLYEIVTGAALESQIKDVDIADLLGRKQFLIDNSDVYSYIENEVVLVTGGGGSIGSELCRQIAKYSPRLLIVFDIYENNAYALQQEMLSLYPNTLNMLVLIGSVRDKKRLEEVFEQFKPGVVFHAAAHKHVPLMEDSPNEALKNNVYGTYNVATCAEKYGTKRFILISTDKAVNPTNIMGASKRLAEMVIQQISMRAKNTVFSAVRFGNVLGSNGSVIPLFKEQIKNGGPVTVTHPEINRFFMTIPEAAQLVMHAGALASGGEIFILDMGSPVKIVDLARNLIRLSGFVPDVDIKIEFTGLRPGEKMYEELLLDRQKQTATKNDKIFIEKPIENKEVLIEEIKRLKERLSCFCPMYDEVGDWLSNEVMNTKDK